MSKKSSTFVARLGIVPRMTILSIRVMRIETLCRLMISGKVFRLQAVYDQEAKVASFYRIMVGRKRMNLSNYPTIDYALKEFNGIVCSLVVFNLSKREV